MLQRCSLRVPTLKSTVTDISRPENDVIFGECDILHGLTWGPSQNKDYVLPV